MKKAVAFLLCALLAALSFAEGAIDEDAMMQAAVPPENTIASGADDGEAMAFLGEIKDYGTNRSERLTEEDVLNMFRAAARAKSVSVDDGKPPVTWYVVYDISNVQILNPVTMKKDKGCKAIEFVEYGWMGDRYLAFVKRPDTLRRIDAMIKTGNTSLLEEVHLTESTRNPKIADVLWTNGEMYKVTWLE